VSLLDSYECERSAAADENIGHSTRSTDFIAPRTAQETRFRDAALALAAHADFAKRMVNSGRLSTPSTYDTPLSTPDRDAWAGSARLGAPLPDAPMRDEAGQPLWLLDAVGSDTVLLHVMGDDPPPQHPKAHTLVVGRDLVDAENAFARRFDASPGATWLIRPDQHLCARWRKADQGAIDAAIKRMTGAA
jgi:3-(3-hydroxy-phenyl)propionate hydroxylase